AAAAALYLTPSAVSQQLTALEQETGHRLVERGAWLRGTALTAGAHAASSVVKRVVRRPRPAHVEPLVGTVGRHSFPSSHATSAAAAAVAFGALGARAVPPLAAAVCVSRLVAGVHYPSDVAAGAALGALTARLGARWMTGGTA
ncbi:phosphatase PAP2 family protein, partial [Streptomyces sp. S-9]|uniref:phosphatase PAP2 family protein n=1 Tax=Streptomyces sp. S-9 TaxID=2806600 RepID=UPI00193B2F46